MQYDAPPNSNNVPWKMRLESGGLHGGELGRHAQAVVVDLDGQTAVAAARADVNLAPRKPGGEAVFDGVFDDGLQQHAGHKRVESFLVNFLENLQFVGAETDDFDVEIVVNEIELFAQHDKGLVFPQQAPQDVRKLQHHASGHVRIEANQRRDGVESVE